MTKNNELNKRIRKLRITYKYTQKELADTLGIDVSTYAHYEKGDRIPSAYILKKIAELYGLRDDLLGVQLPIERVVTYDKKDLETLRRELNECRWIPGDNIANNAQYERLKKAIEPIFKANDEAFSVPEIDKEYLIPGQKVLSVRLNPEGEWLIRRYFEEVDKCLKTMGDC